MKILFLWEISGISCNIANYIRENQLGQVKILHRKTFDPFNYKKIFNDIILVEGNVKNYYKKCYQTIKEFKPDIIHINDFEKGVLLTKLITPKTPIIFQYHGTKLRKKMKIPYYVKKLTKEIFVSTSDLLISDTKLLQVPIPDFSIKIEKILNTALFVRTTPLDKTYRAYLFAKKNNLKLTILNKMKDENITIINQLDFLSFLSKFEYYLDLKGLTNEKVLSKTGLEALKLNCKVLTDNNKLITDFKFTHAKDYIKIYRKYL